MRQGVPMNPVAAAVMQGVSEIVVEVQNIYTKGVGKSPAEEVCLDNILTKLCSFVFNLGSTQEKERVWRAGGGLDQIHCIT